MRSLRPSRPAPTLFLLALALLVHVSEARPAPPPRHVRAVVISVDGLRPDLILRADAPTMRALMARGSFTLWATTIPASVTLPSHASMLTGVPPSRHGIDWNSDLPLAKPTYPAVPTLFDAAKAAGYTTAMAAGKSKFKVLNRPGSLDWCFVSSATAADSVVADTATAWIRTHRPDVLFVHLPEGDVIGHRNGWGSAEQLAAVAGADRCIARILAATAENGTIDSTYVLVTADHGGQGRTHGPDDARSRTIPWILAGPGIRQNLDLASIDVSVKTEDTFATVCQLLGVTTRKVDGRFVAEAVAGVRADTTARTSASTH
jgi:predicted AlkP superfamily pyrophosphatase or phosphodiesterase